MSKSILTIIRCHAFLVLISIIFHAEALTSSHPWKTEFAGDQCVWRHDAIDGADLYQLEYNRNLPHVNRNYASLYRLYKLDVHADRLEGMFCLFVYADGLRARDHLILIIDSQRFFIGYNDVNEKCIAYVASMSDGYDFKVSFNATCNRLLGNPQISRIEARIRPLQPTTPMNEGSTNFPGEPTSDVGDIQYVGVVVGAICIALFTLFSCLTIISARRSNQRDIRRRTIPSASCPEDDDRPDVVADNAPPSYDAVMACPDLYPPTPQDTPHATPETTPHLSLHRRALLNQHVGSLPDSAAGTPQLHRQSFTPTIASDEWEEIPEYPPPPYPGLSNGDISTLGPEDGTDNVDTLDETTGVNNHVVSEPRTDNSRPSSPNSSSADGDQENPWVRNNIGDSHLRDRDNNPDRDTTAEQYPMRARTPDGDSTHSNHDEDSHEDLSSSSNSPEVDRTEHRIPKPIDSGPANVSVRVAVV